MILHMFLMSCLLQLNRCLATHMHNIYWNASNPIFHNQNHVIDVNAGNHPWEYDQVNLVCPVYKPGTSERMEETYIVYSVSKQEYDTCRITQANPRVVAVCNQPHNLMYFTITFRSFTPTPGGLEFRPGQDYYFISTSSKSDLHRRVGGGCSSHNMKIVFRVAPDNKDNDGQKETQSSNLIPNRQQLDNLRELFQRKKLLRHHQKKVVHHQKVKKEHHVGGGPHQVLYYPWKEMIRGQTGYSDPETSRIHSSSLVNVGTPTKFSLTLITMMVTLTTICSWSL